MEAKENTNKTAQHENEQEVKSNDSIKNACQTDRQNEVSNAGESTADKNVTNDSAPSDPLKEAQAEIAKLRAELEAERRKNQELNNQRLRALADYDNLKKRSARDILNAINSGSEELVKKLLPVLDSFESALRQLDETKVEKKILDGFQMLCIQFSDVLEKEGLKPIECKGKKFDPNMHEALMKRSDPNLEDEIVVAEIEKGYMFKEKVIRPAKVEINQR